MATIEKNMTRISNVYLGDGIKEAVNAAVEELLDTLGLVADSYEHYVFEMAETGDGKSYQYDVWVDGDVMIGGSFDKDELETASDLVKTNECFMKLQERTNLDSIRLMKLAYEDKEFADPEVYY